MKRILLSLALCLGAAGGSFAQSRMVSLPDTIGVPGTVLQLPVRVSGISPSDGVTSAQFTFTFPSTEFDLIGVSLTGTLLESSGSVEFNSALKRVAVASPDTLSGNGVLFHLNLRVRSNATKYSTHSIGFADAILNEGVPSMSTDPGTIRVKGLTIQPGYVNNLLLSDTLAFRLTGDGQAPFTWSVSNTSIARIDADGVLRPQTLGFVRVHVTDSQGLRDSTNLFRIQPSALANLTISMPDTTIRQTRVLRMPVRTSDLTGIGASSFETVITYPPSALTFLGIDTIGTAVSGGPSPLVNQIADRIRVAYASDTPLSGSGELFALRFQVSPTYQGGVSLGFQEARFNEDLIPILDHGSVNILPAPPILLSPNPLHTTPGRSVALSVSGTGTAPYTYHIEASGIASESNGTVTGIARGVTRVRAIDSEGFPSPWVPLQVFDIEARLPDTTVVYPDTMRLPLTVEALDGLDVRSVEAIVRIDTTMFRWLGWQRTSLTEGMSVEAERKGNDIRLAFAGNQPLRGSGALFALSFVPRPGTADNARMPVQLMRLRFNETSDTTATAQLISGALTNDWNWQVPTAPKRVNAELIEGVSFGVRLTWELPDTNGGRPITDYIIEYRDTTASAPWTLHSDGISTERTTSLTSLPGRKTYLFRVSAVNSEGRGPAAESQPVDVGFAVPTAPQSVLSSPLPGSEIAMSLSWTPPSDNGGYAITDYQIEFKRSSDSDWTPFTDGISAATNATVGGLQPAVSYDFRVAAVNRLGRGPFSSPVSATDLESSPETVLVTALLGNYPNPFNPTTQIRYQLSASGHVRLTVFDILGRQVAVLAEGTQPAGHHSIAFDASGLTSGVYLYRLDTDSRSFTKTLLLVK